MFQKKEIIVSETYGVCRVDEITKLAEKNGDASTYYVLRSIYDKSKVSYIPVENHQVALRELITKEEAQEQLEKAIKEQNLTELACGEIAYVLGMKYSELWEKYLHESGISIQ